MKGKIVGIHREAKEKIKKSTSRSGVSLQILEHNKQLVDVLPVTNNSKIFVSGIFSVRELQKMFRQLYKNSSIEDSTPSRCECISKMRDQYWGYLIELCLEYSDAAT